MKGPAGYGRYDDDPAYVGCPFARSDMSPCVARDGQLALDVEDLCAGCGNTPEYLIGDLAADYRPAEVLAAEAGEPQGAADAFAAMVREATEPGRGAAGGTS
jgi:hypothetical protein